MLFESKKLHRGRPKGTNKSLNVKYGKAGTGSRRRQRDADENTVDQTICHVCYEEDPDKAKMSGSQIDWVDCSKDCKRWFHVVCLPANVELSDYSCTFCARSRR